MPALNTPSANNPLPIALVTAGQSAQRRWIHPTFEFQTLCDSRGRVAAFRPAAHDRRHAFGVEALTQQIAVHAAEDRRIAQRHPMTEAALERLLEERRLIDLREDFSDGLPRDIARDAERFDLPDDARASAMLDAYLGPRAGERRAAVVERAFAEQPRHRGVDILFIEFPPREARPKLRFSQLAAGQEGEAGDVRPVGVRHQCLSGAASCANAAWDG